MDFFISSAYAQAAGGAAQPPSLIGTFAFPLLLLGVFYFLLIRPQMKRAKEQRAMVSALAKGDEVVTSAGMLGRIAEITESYVAVEIAPNVVVKLQKQAIAAVLPKGTLKSA